MTTELTAAPRHDGDGGLFFLNDDDFVHHLTSPAVRPDVVDVDGTVTLTAIGTISNPKRPRGWRSRVRGALRIAARVLSDTRRRLESALAVVAAAVGWLTRDARSGWSRRRYRGRHHLSPAGLHRVARTVLGRERSSAEFSRAAQLRAREPRSPEGDLVFRDGDTFVSWVAVALESAHHLHEARREPAHVWHCS